MAEGTYCVQLEQRILRVKLSGGCTSSQGTAPYDRGSLGWRSGQGSSPRGSWALLRLPRKWAWPQGCQSSRDAQGEVVGGGLGRAWNGLDDPCGSLPTCNCSFRMILSSASTFLFYTLKLEEGSCALGDGGCHALTL